MDTKTHILSLLQSLCSMHWSNSQSIRLGVFPPACLQSLYLCPFSSAVADTIVIVILKCSKVTWASVVLKLQTSFTSNENNTTFIIITVWRSTALKQITSDSWGLSYAINVSHISGLTNLLSFFKNANIGKRGFNFFFFNSRFMSPCNDTWLTVRRVLGYNNGKQHPCLTVGNECSGRLLH